VKDRNYDCNLLRCYGCVYPGCYGCRCDAYERMAVCVSAPSLLGAVTMACVEDLETRTVVVEVAVVVVVAATAAASVG